MEKLIKARLLNADLIEIDRLFEDANLKSMLTIILLKQSFVTVANLVDFELTVRAIYSEHRELSSIYDKTSKENEFIKYLRNKFVGHIKPELLTKAIEWKPELKYMIKNIDDPEFMFVCNLWILETAINTYVNSDGTHKIFDSQIDFIYPPDIERFLIFLTQVIKYSIKYLNALINILNSEIKSSDKIVENDKDWRIAANTNFKYIRK